MICTLDEGAKLGMEFTVDIGKGYVPAERQPPGGCADRPDPGRRDLLAGAQVSLQGRADPRRPGHRLRQAALTVETNGAVTPEDAVALAARILQDQLQLFINFDEPQQMPRRREPQDDLPFNRNLLRRSTSWSCRSARPTA